MTTTVLETCRISPPPAVAELTLPLCFFDMLWIHFHPVSCLLFYNYTHCSNAEFVETVVPKLKQSLSLTLKHYLPVAGKLVYPSNTADEKPVLRYVPGDSVPLTIAESNSDFDELVANHARDADQFYDFVPQMPPVVDEPAGGHKLVPLTTLKATLFPGRGICLGVSIHHSLGDANSIVRFILAWASINKFDGDDEFLTINEKSLPNFDRRVVQNTSGIDSIFWNANRKVSLKESHSFPLPTNRVRSTFILTQTHINNLKDVVISHKPDLHHVSSFVVTTSYVWTCLAKSRDAIGADECEVFLFSVDVRGRLNALINPPVPLNYFGNCLNTAVVKVEHKKVVGEEGFVVAAEAIADEIKNRVNNKDEFMKGVENLLSILGEIRGMKAITGVSGSPKFDLANADFGWGKARKLEFIAIDEDKYSMCISKSMHEFEGGIEVGLSLPKETMDAFAHYFLHGLK